MNKSELELLLSDLRDCRVAVLGDFCLDIYWFIDPSASEISLETGLETRPVARQRYSPGGAGNVVNNLAALGCRHIHAVGAVGDDPWGRELIRQLKNIKVNTNDMVVQADKWATLAYTKPHMKDIEDHRLDFGNFNVLSNNTARIMLDRVNALLPEIDMVIINQQVKQGIHTSWMRQNLASLVQQRPEKALIVDSRHYSDSYPGALLKINDHEAARLAGIQRPPEAMILRSEVITAANALFDSLKKPVFVTRQNRGCLVWDNDGIHEIPGIQVLGKIDTVGAGDSMLAGIALALAAGRSPADAAEFGNFSAAVTIQKLRHTGTASPEEILAIGSDPDYNYRPDLADDVRQARYLPGTEFEIITEIPPDIRVSHAIFDHDGTISTLRQGWEEIMEPMMIRAILGPRFHSADESLYHQVVNRVRDYIDKSTGIRTIVQMRTLVDMVREFGCVPEQDILDETGYKQIYNKELMNVVRQRLSKLERGELARDDFVIKNAVTLLKKIHQKGVIMFLASGTDEQDVIIEARALGYADLFQGGIYGSKGTTSGDVKRIVLDRIMTDIGKKALTNLVTFGDGPVEIRETRKRGGFAIGIASDEVRRFGINQTKRARLVRAGADLIIPDFSQLEQLLQLLRINRSANFEIPKNRARR